MLNQLRNFSKGKLAAVLVAIIIIPFVFGVWEVFLVVEIQIVLVR